MPSWQSEGGIMRAKAYIVHLGRAVGRQPQAKLLAESLPIPGEILPAIDGREMTEEARAAVVRRKIHSPRYPFPLNVGEVGCFLSHRNAWQAIIDDRCDAGLIIEDDVGIASPEFTAVVQAGLAAIQPDEVIRFPLHERGESNVVARTLGSVRFLEPRLPGLGMQMQLVGNEAARRLLDGSRLFDRPVDSYVQMQWLHGARVLSARPVVISENDAMLGGTVIQNKKMSLVEKAVHEMTRPLLRLAVRNANEQWRKRAA
jgi:GR25 family glycosyltransferase involved in LPS biosynthesis